MNKTSIEWTHRPETGGADGGFTWNPIRAKWLDHEVNPGRHSGTFCTRISPGCANCYASVINKRFGNGLEYTVPNLEKVEFYIDEKILAEPLKRKKPATIFVGDMFDLFHEAIPTELLDRVFAVIAHCSQTWYRCKKQDCDHCPCGDTLEEHAPHTFQVLTKRADRMRAYFSATTKRVLHERLMKAWDQGGWWFERPPITDAIFPLPNVWLGVSVESQKYADERIPLLLQTPAAVRFLSVEPMLGPVKLDTWLYDGYYELKHAPGIDWVICGGESGPGARPFNLAWAESLLEECGAAGVPFFMKQLGSKPIWDECRVAGIDSKGGNMEQWPEHLRVREFPTTEKLVTV